jgi:hypothetical protein
MPSLEKLQALTDSDSRLGRSRFLTILGGGLVAGATKLAITTTPAYAWDSPEPSPCFGYGLCHCCSGSDCCQSECYYTHYDDCPGGGQCWTTAVPVGGGCYDLYYCCDYSVSGFNPHKHCICRSGPQRVC